MLLTEKVNEVNLTFYFQKGKPLKKKDTCFTPIDYFREPKRTVVAIKYKPRWEDCVNTKQELNSYFTVLSAIFPEIGILKHSKSISMYAHHSGAYILAVFRLIRAMEERPWQIRTLYNLRKTRLFNPYFLLLASQNIVLEGKDTGYKIVSDYYPGYKGHYTLPNTAFNKKAYKELHNIVERINKLPPYTEVQRYKIEGYHEIFILFNDSLEEEKSVLGDSVIQKYLGKEGTYKYLIKSLLKIQTKWEKP